MENPTVYCSYGADLVVGACSQMSRRSDRDAESLGLRNFQGGQVPLTLTQRNRDRALDEWPKIPASTQPALWLSANWAAAGQHIPESLGSRGESADAALDDTDRSRHDGINQRNCS